MITHKLTVLIASMFIDGSKDPVQRAIDLLVAALPGNTTYISTTTHPIVGLTVDYALFFNNDLLPDGTEIEILWNRTCNTFYGKPVQYTVLGEIVFKFPNGSTSNLGIQNNISHTTASTPNNVLNHSGHNVVNNSAMGKDFKYCRDCGVEA